MLILPGGPGQSSTPDFAPSDDPLVVEFEHTVHVREDQWGRGVGRLLVMTLMERATIAGKHVMVAAIDGDNVESIAVHERLGFTTVARMPEVGTKWGRWLDLVLMQRILAEQETRNLEISRSEALEAAEIKRRDKVERARINTELALEK